MKYMGSKNRLSKDIVPIIQSYVDKGCCGYIEPFVGGANVIDKIKCDSKYGFDNNLYLIALLNQAKTDNSIFPSTISKELYKDVRTHMEEKYDEWFIGLVGFCASYNSKWFGGYANNVKTKQNTIRNYTDESIRNLIKQSNAIEFQRCNFFHKSFLNLDIDKIQNYVIYCDPPYKNTTKYTIEDFPYNEFYEWCKKLSQNNIVLISEYWMPKEFECIWSKKIKCTLNNNKYTDKIEKIFLYKGD